MKSDKTRAQGASHEMGREATPDSLLRQTLRTMAILVGASVIFVGALSVVAVTVTSKAVGAKPSASQADGDVGAGGASGGSGAPKKPMSI